MNNKTTFYIVRHGETDWNVARRIQGHTDIPLNEKGELQAKERAESLKHVKFDLAFSSDLIRAKRTAEIIALERKLVIQTTEALREKNFGRLEGVDSKTVHAYFDVVNKLSQAERLKARIVEDAETDEELISRLLTFIRETAIANPGKTVLVATHGTVIRHLLIHLGVHTHEEMEKSAIANTAYVHFDTDGVEFEVKEVYGVMSWEEFEKDN